MGIPGPKAMPGSHFQEVRIGEAVKKHLARVEETHQLIPVSESARSVEVIDSAVTGNQGRRGTAGFHAAGGAAHSRDLLSSPSGSGS